MMKPKTTVVIGQAGQPFGIKGEIKIRPYTESVEAFERSRVLYFDETPYEVLRIRVHKGAVLASLKGVDSPEQAKTLRGCQVRTDPENLPPKGDDEYYWHELIGMRVFTTDGRDLGVVAGLIPTGAHDVLSVQGPFGEVLLPMIEDVLKEVHTERGEMIVDPLEGLIPDA
ncbi:MAG: ribosome maturation factor RimM [Thermodesulfobacteriota bacterium]